MVTQQCKKLPNWKAPEHDGVQRFWFKKMHSLHNQIATQMNDIINSNISLPEWMTKGKTVLCQTDPAKGNEVGNFRPISCLPLMWKLMTGIVSEKIYRPRLHVRDGIDPVWDRFQTVSIRKFRLRLHGIDPRTFRVYTGSILDRTALGSSLFCEERACVLLMSLAKQRR